MHPSPNSGFASVTQQLHNSGATSASQQQHYCALGVSSSGTCAGKTGAAIIIMGGGPPGRNPYTGRCTLV